LQYAPRRQHLGGTEEISEDKGAPMKALKRYGGIALAIILVLVGIFFVKDPLSAGQFVSNYFAAGEFALAGCGKTPDFSHFSFSIW